MLTEPEVHSVDEPIAEPFASERIDEAHMRRVGNCFLAALGRVQRATLGEILSDYRKLREHYTLEALAAESYRNYGMDKHQLVTWVMAAKKACT